MSKFIKLRHPKDKDKIKELRTRGFSFGGLVLGPILYIGWGMWRKGLSLLLLTILLIIFNDIIFSLMGIPMTTPVFSQILMFYCAFAINKDNYNHHLKSGWIKYE